MQVTVSVNQGLDSASANLRQENVGTHRETVNFNHNQQPIWEAFEAPLSGAQKILLK